MWSDGKAWSKAASADYPRAHLLGHGHSHSGGRLASTANISDLATLRQQYFYSSPKVAATENMIFKANNRFGIYILFSVIIFNTAYVLNGYFLYISVSSLYYFLFSIIDGTGQMLTVLQNSAHEYGGQEFKSGQ